MKRPTLLMTATAVATLAIASSPSPSGARAATPTPQTATTADEAAHAAHASAIENLPIAVDGSKNPEKIPMDLAYRHFIRAIAGPRAQQDETDDIIDRRRAHVTRMGLSSVDEVALSTAMRGLGDALQVVELTRRRGAADPMNITVDLNALRVQERELLDTAWQRLGLVLSAEGAQHLEQYVQEHVRRRITIFGELPQ